MKLNPPVTLLLVLGLVIPFRARSATYDASALANQFVDLLAENDFGQAVTRCDEIMRTEAPEPKLRGIWQGLQGKVGRFNRRSGTRVLAYGGQNIALVTCEFERATLDAKVVLDATGRVGGLWFEPASGQGCAALPPYRTNAFRETTFMVGREDWRLPGTLTVPNDETAKPWPVVVLVQGSGHLDRDETVGGVKVFRDLAWGLASRGIAVLRYEKRTKQYADRFPPLGKLRITVREETIDDALDAVKRLRKTEGIDPKRIFVLGHSLGGTVAPRIGLADPQIAGLIIMAGATRPLEDVVLQQFRYVYSLKGPLSRDEQEMLSKMELQGTSVKELTTADAASPKTLLGAPVVYWLDLREHDPVTEARQLKQPLLILQGGRDYQVTQEDFDGWKRGLGNLPTVTFKWYPQLNHMFVAGEGKCTPQEYDKPGHVAQAVVTDIEDWIILAKR